MIAPAPCCNLLLLLFLHRKAVHGATDLVGVAHFVSYALEAYHPWAAVYVERIVCFNEYALSSFWVGIGCYMAFLLYVGASSGAHGGGPFPSGPQCR